MNKKFFSIITATYNAEETIQYLLDSLSSQTCRDFNLILQDGKSSDNTISIVNQYYQYLPEILIDSRRDKGIYDAWNIAIDLWKDKLGEWVIFLGADDVLTSNHTLEKVKERLSNSQDFVLFGAGDIEIIDPISGHSVPIKLKSPEDCFNKKSFKIPFPHSSLFTRKSILVNIKFDNKFKIYGDYDFILKTLKYKYQIKLLNITVTKMSNNGISNTENDLLFKFYETVRLFIKHKSFRGIIRSFDFLIYRQKIFIKKYLQKYSYGIKIWNLLHKIRQKLLPY